MAYFFIILTEIYTEKGHIHRWARYFKKVAERALNALALALYKAIKAIAALKKKNAKAQQNVITIAPAWDRTGAALARSKRLNYYPVVEAYFCHVR